MEKNTLVLVLDPEDPQVFDLRRPSAGEPIFGIVLDIVAEVLNGSGRYLELRCRIQDDNKRIEVLPTGRLVPLLVLPEEDAASLTPKEAFSKWAAEITKRQALVHLPRAQRDFLVDMFYEPAER